MHPFRIANGRRERWLSTSIGVPIRCSSGRYDRRPKRECHSWRRNRVESPALGKAPVIGGRKARGLAKAAVNELVSLKPSVNPISVTEKTGFDRSALARSMRRLV